MESFGRVRLTRGARRPPFDKARGGVGASSMRHGQVFPLPQPIRRSNPTTNLHRNGASNNKGTAGLLILYASLRHGRPIHLP